MKTDSEAPGADLYFIASNLCNMTGNYAGNDYACMAQSIRRMLEINDLLPQERRIRVLSISVAWMPGSIGYEEVEAAVLDAKDAGIFVLSTGVEADYGFKFHAMGRAALADPDRFESYEPGWFWVEQFYSGDQAADRLLVPMDARTTASPGGRGEFVFYREGGWSWCVPYIAGVYALAAQVDPAITPEVFWKLALQTGRVTEIEHGGETFPFGTILDPAALVIALQQ